MQSIVVDLERLRHLHCGLGQYCLHLGRALVDAHDPQIQPVFLMPSNRIAEFNRPGSSTIPVARRRRESHQKWLRPWHPASRCSRYQLWHTTHQDSKYLPANARIPVVLTIHDLNFLREKMPASIQRRFRRLQMKVNRASAIITGSEFAANEIRKYLDVHGKTISVIPHGVCLHSPQSTGERPAFLPSGRFLFSIGDITPKKNVHTLVELARRLPEYQIVIAGKNSNDYAAEILRMVDQAGLGDRVRLPGMVSDLERSWLYRHCDAFLFPSISEGFGLPLIEAMSCGRPVFSSSSTSLPEVGGPLCFYWRDFNPDSMVTLFREGMATFASDPLYGRKLELRAAEFRWDDAARKYLAVYKSVLGQSATRMAA